MAVPEPPEFFFWQAAFEKSSPQEFEEYLFSLVDLTGDGHVTRYVSQHAPQHTYT